MIKSLLNADEDPPPGTKVIIEETIAGAPSQTNEPAAQEEIPAPAPETQPGFEIPEDAQFFSKSGEASPEPERLEDVSADVSEPTAPVDEDSESLSALMADIENLDDRDLDLLERQLETDAPPAPLGKRIDEPEMPKIFEDATPPAPVETEKNVENTAGAFASGTLFQTEEKPRQSMAETIRQSGLAYSAAIVLFGSIIFTMLLGWFADLLLGSSPWGIVGGIILGGIIGFIQFFRMTSQIFKK